MTDSPAHQAPLDPQEKPILDSLLSLRDQLLLLKQDKSTYIKSQDVVAIYDRVVGQVHGLNELRARDGKPLESNRVDRVLDDCFQLLSLFFLTVGRNDEAPAAYALSSTIKRLLDHLKEASFFSGKDLESMTTTLDKIQVSLQKGKASHAPHLCTLLENRLEACRRLVAELKSILATVSPSVLPTYEKLVSILRSMAAANTRSKFPQAEVEGYRAQLVEIKTSMKQENVVNNQGAITEGQTLASELLNRCFLVADLVLEKKGKIDPRFNDIYSELCEIRNQLERLSLTHAWSLRETDLFNYQRQLDRYDESRVDGSFVDKLGQPAELHAQRTLLYLLRRSYAYIYLLMIQSEPVSEALLPIFNQLQTLKRCLVEVKRSGGVSSARELYPYSMKLSSIEKMRVDGKFMVGSDIPEGQASVSVLLAECFDMQSELRTEAAERESHVKK